MALVNGCGDPGCPVCAWAFDAPLEQRTWPCGAATYQTPAGVRASVPVPVELLREARDNCQASIAEDGISAHRKEYRIDLHKRLSALIDGVAPSVDAKEIADRLWAKQEQQRQTDDYQTGYSDALGDFFMAITRGVLEVDRG